MVAVLERDASGRIEVQQEARIDATYFVLYYYLLLARIIIDIIRITGIRPLIIVLSRSEKEVIEVVI